MMILGGSRRRVLTSFALFLLQSDTVWADDDEPVYDLVDTLQTSYYDNSVQINTIPTVDEQFYGQDARFQGMQPFYVVNGDATITDGITGLMWTQMIFGKFTVKGGLNAVLNMTVGGYDDWRVPSVKELYSLMNFRGTAPDESQYFDYDLVEHLTPFIDDEVFQFFYASSPDPIVDVTQMTYTPFVDAGVTDTPITHYGVNFADGTIRGIDGEETFYVRFVRGDRTYGTNDFNALDDRTIEDQTTGLMWQQFDSGYGMIWSDALAYCTDLDLGGHEDWRLPNAKELQSIVDYTRSPDSTRSAAIRRIFTTTPITNENNEADFPYFWSSTTHVSANSSTLATNAAYVAFGRGLGFDGTNWIDIHGAGSQKFDPKTGVASLYPEGRGPDGDAVRIENYVRCVRWYRFSNPMTLMWPGVPCISPHAIADVKGKGRVPIKDIAPGDEVMTGSGNYQTVYSIDHRHDTKATKYIRIHTDMDENPLEITPKHLVFIEGKQNPVTASNVKVGDSVQTLDGPKEVVRISTIKRSGLYNPLTPDGTIVVDGIIASTYSSYDENTDHLEISGFKLLPIQTVVNMFATPYRAFCMGTSLSLCNQHKELAGVSVFLTQLYKFWSQQTAMIQWSMFAIYLLVFGFVSLVLSPYGIAGAVALVGWISVCSKNKRRESVN